MTQGVLPFKYEESKKSRSLTSFSGLLPYVELLYQMDFFNLVKRYVRVHGGEQGWLDGQILLSLILLNLAGGDCPEDIERLENDKGFCKAMLHLEKRLLGDGSHKRLSKRFRRGRGRCFPSPNAIRSYMERYHNAKGEASRKHGEAYIPDSTTDLEGLYWVTAGFPGFVQNNKPEEMATLDGDAVLIASEKSEALYCYKKFKSYQPLNVSWYEQRQVVHSEFRDGNVPAGYELKRVVSQSLSMLPPSVKNVRFRGDGAAYQYELMDFFQKGGSERFGRIEFAISCIVSDSFKRSVSEVEEDDWETIHLDIGNGLKIKRKQQWAEVGYVSRIESPDYRYIVIRERVECQRYLPGFEEQEPPFPYYEGGGVRYRLSGLVTNMDWEGEELIHWSRKRCGNSEHIHSVMKGELCGGQLPSGKFGANACWWQVMIMALNLHEMLKRLTLPSQWHNRRPKALRYWFINVAGCVVKSGRQIKLILDRGQRAFGMYIHCRREISRLVPLPGG